MEASLYKISCVVPVYNGAKYIHNAIKSIREQEEPWELIVVDGGSTDGTQDIVESYKDPRIKLIEAGYPDEPEVREDIGISHATGDYYHNLGCDDIVLKDAYKMIRKQKGEWIYGNMIIMDSRYNLIRENRSPIFNYHHYMQGNILGTPCSFVSLDLIKENNLKHPNRWPNGDYYFLRTVARYVKPTQIHNMLVGIMQRRDSITGQNIDNFSKYKEEMIAELNAHPLPEYAKNEVVNPKILVAVCNQGWIRPEVANVLNNITHDSRARTKIIYPTQRPYENNLSHVVNKVKKEGWDYLLIIDDDNPPLQNPIDLAFMNLDVVGCPTPQWNEVDKFPIYWVAMDKVGGGYKPHKEMDGLQEVDAVGSGCMMIKRKVLEALEAPFTRDWNSDGTVKTGVDFHFCEKAKEKGFRIWAHYDYICDHFKELSLLNVLKFKNTN